MMLKAPEPIGEGFEEPIPRKFLETKLEMEHFSTYKQSNYVLKLILFIIISHKHHIKHDN